MTNNMTAFWRDRRVCITGATGLMGSHLVPVLQKAGAFVVAYVRDHVPDAYLWSSSERQSCVTVHGDLTHYASIARTINEYEVDIVFHLGAQTIVPIANRNPLPTFETNIRGTYHVLEACRLASTIKAVIVASSDKAYGNQQHLPYDETMPLQGTYPYDVSKSCADLLAQAYYQSYALPICVTRFANVFGPGDLNFNRLIPGTIRSIHHQESPIIRSDGSFIRDYLYVKDAASAYCLLAEKMWDQDIHGEAFNVSYGLRLSAQEIVQKILHLMESNLRPTVLNAAKGEIRDQYLSVAKAHDHLQWKPQYDIDEAMRETITWYKRYFYESR